VSTDSPAPPRNPFSTAGAPRPTAGPRHRAAGDDPAGESALRIVWLCPDLMSTYGDRGNMLILARRAYVRGIPVETVEVRSNEPVPQEGDIYLLGGGEDGAQALAAQRLNANQGLHRAVARGATTFVVCAGYQLVGTSFFAKGEKCAGLGILDLSSDRGPSRAVGEIAGVPDPALGLPPITGFENHGGRTHLGPGLKPLAQVTTGVGNDTVTEGVWQGKLIGTYMHGPALARNPALADLLISWAIDAPVEPIDDTWPERLRAERFAAIR
jgi:CobQ-like glutamine amidotransferase family enzyme